MVARAFEVQRLCKDGSLVGNCFKEFSCASWFGNPLLTRGLQMSVENMVTFTSAIKLMGNVKLGLSSALRADLPRHSFSMLDTFRYSASKHSPNEVTRVCTSARASLAEEIVEGGFGHLQADDSAGGSPCLQAKSSQRPDRSGQMRWRWTWCLGWEALT